MVLAIPEGVGNVVPYLCVRGAAKAIEFYKAAFGAEVMSTMPMGEDLIGHADLKIGSARVYLADEMPGWGAVKSPISLKGTSSNIHLWVEDCDATFASAVGAGAKVAMPLVDQFWGDRYGMVIDPFGHAWAISSHKEDLTPEEMMRRGQEAMAQMAQAAEAARKRETEPAPRRNRRARPASAASRKAAPKAATKGTVAKSTVSKTKTAPKAQGKAKPGANTPGSEKPRKAKAEKSRSGKPKKDKKSKKSKKDKKRKKKSKR